MRILTSEELAAVSGGDCLVEDGANLWTLAEGGAWIEYYPNGAMEWYGLCLGGNMYWAHC